MKLTTLTTTLLLLHSAWTSAATEPSPYAGQQTRQIKALSHDDVSDYLSGKGMGFAKAAELNGYPGPSHVLQLADELQLTPDQRTATQRIFDDMQSQARSLGSRLVDAEKHLDHLFASKTVTLELLSQSLEGISTLQATLRDTHLQAHIAQTRVLTEQQIKRYEELRGYGASHTIHGSTHSH